MTATIGSTALLIGLAAAVVWTLGWLAAAVTGRRSRIGNASVLVGFAAAVVACGALEWALIGHDFTVRYVAENGGRRVPLYFTVTSLWAALDGSVLLWVLILSATGVLLSRSRRQPPQHGWAMVTVGFVTVFFFAVAFFAANPFAGAPAVLGDGPGPNPLLREHPAMGVHPPLLYAGYIGLVVPFAYCVGALVTGEPDGMWLHLARRWALGSWMVLSAGIVLGAWWSYAVLGWGGYWAWDPVENASLLPWLTATAALHVTLRRQGRPVSAGWGVSLFGATFLLVLIGTFLTRSGAVASVHSFTASPLGPMLLGFVVAVLAVCAGLLVWRGIRMAAVEERHDWRSGQAMLLANAALLVAMAAVVLTGTLYPLVTQLLSGERSTVGAEFYNHAALPVGLAVLALMGIGQLSATEASTAGLGRRLLVPALFGFGVTAAVGFLTRPSALAAVAFGVAAFVLVGVLVGRRLSPGLLAHTGVAVLCIGIAASSSYSVAGTAELDVGQSARIAGTTTRLVGTDRVAEPDRITVTAQLEVSDAGHTEKLTPRLHYYPGRDMTVGAPAVRSAFTGDTYATLTAVDGAGRHVSIRLARNSFVWLIWLGGAILAAAGCWALARSWRSYPGSGEGHNRAEPVVADAVVPT